MKAGFVTCYRRIDDPTLEYFQKVPSCQWGMSGYCGQKGSHKRCYFTLGPEAIDGYFDVDDFGHRWVCQCPCHVNQGYPPCPGEHDGFQALIADSDVQPTLF